MNILSVGYVARIAIWISLIWIGVRIECLL